MAIAKKPLRNLNAISAGDTDKAAEAFISKAGKAANIGKTPVLFRFKPDFLARIDAAAKNMNCRAWLGSGPSSRRRWKLKGFSLRGPVLNWAKEFDNRIF